MKEEKQWFALDSFDDQDPAVVAMCTVYKMEGFGRWLKLLMVLRTEAGYRYDITQVYAYKVLASRMMTTEAKARAFIADLINTYGLLRTDDKYIWADWLNERMERMDNMKAQRSRAGKKSAELRNKVRATEAEQESNETEIVLQQKTNEAANLLQQKSTHNTTIQNITEQNTTEQSPKAPKAFVPTGRQVVEIEVESTGLNHPQHEPKTVLPVALPVLPCATQPSPLERAGGGLSSPSPEMTGTLPSPLGGAGGGFEAQRLAALADERFVYPFVSGRGITLQQLGDWLTAFNRMLGYDNAPEKDDRDYRRHFAQWFKYRDPATEDPRVLGVVPQPILKPQPRNPLGYLKTPEQLQAAEAEAIRRLTEERKM